MILESEGIVLKQTKTINGRKMLSIFTPKYGKVSVGANITPSKTSKTALYTRPFTYARYHMFNGKNSFSLNSAEVIESYYKIGEDFDKYVSSSLALELTDKLLMWDDPNEPLFMLLKDFLKEMMERKKSYDTLLLSYMVKVLSITGIMPNLTSCSICNKSDGIGSFFDVKSGGIVCEKCGKNLLNTGDAELLFNVNFDIINVIMYFLKEPLKSFKNIALDTKAEKDLKAILLEYYKYHLDIGELKTEKLSIY